MRLTICLFVLALRYASAKPIESRQTLDNCTKEMKGQPCISYSRMPLTGTWCYRGTCGIDSYFDSPYCIQGAQIKCP